MRELAGQEIGARIAQARNEAGGMTQDELSDLLGVTMRSVQNYESGETIPWKHFERLGEIFDRDLGWFLHGDQPHDGATDPAALEALKAEVSNLGRKVDRLIELVRSQLPETPQEPKARPGGR